MKNQKLTTYWTEIFKAFEQAELSARKFCLKHRVPISNFHYWKRKLQGQNSGDTTSVQNFMHIEEKPIGPT